MPITQIQPYGVDSANSFTFANVTASGNVQAANLRTVGLISATGNITGNFFIGNGSQLTGLTVTATSISSGNSNVTVVSAGGNITTGIAGVGNVVVFSTQGVSVTGNISVSNRVQWANANGGTATVFYMQYNVANAAMDFIFV